jgi:hypothetical protein
VDGVAAQANPPYDHFLILGGDDIVPFYKYANPVGDGDSVIYSDNGYAIAGPVADGEEFFVTRSLARMPTGADPTSETLYNALVEGATAQPQNAGSGGGVYLVAQDWGPWTQSIAQTLGIAPADRHMSLPITLDVNPASLNPVWLDGRAIQFFNLHGDSRTADWYGASGSTTPPAYRPSLVGSAPGIRVKGSVVGTEACFGADVVGTTGYLPRTVNSALSLKYMNEMALGFCGSTTTAYGAAADSPTLRCADLLVMFFLQAVQAGLALGPSLVQAKSKVALTMHQANGQFDAQTQKTLLQFVLYGDPSSIAFMPSPLGSKSLAGFSRLLGATFQGDLGASLGQMGEKKTLMRTVEGSGAEELRSMSLDLPASIRRRQPRLLQVSEHELTWDLGEHRNAVGNLSERLGILSTTFTVPPPKAIWNTESYALKSNLPAEVEYYVRTVQREPIFKLINDGVSRGIGVLRSELTPSEQCRYNGVNDNQRCHTMRTHGRGLKT